MSERKTMGERLDDLVGVFSPAAAARRKAHRQAGKLLSAHFRGARKTRLSYNWVTGQESADAALDGELQTLRDRSRDLNRNNPIAAGITSTFTSNVVGAGIRPQSRVDVRDVPLPQERVRAFQRQAERIWEKWSPWASADLRLHFEEIQELALRQIIESGEFLAVRRMLPEKDGRPYMLALDVIEPDRLEKPSRVDQKDLRFGVERDDMGRPAAYHIRKTHPGETIYSPNASHEHKRVPARDDAGRPIVFHVFPVLRPGQTRGIPWFAPVIEYFQHKADYLEAVLVKERVAACFAAFIKREGNPYDTAVGYAEETNDSGQRLEGLEPGLLEYLEPGESIEFGRPPESGTSFAEFMEKLLRVIGAGLGLPYELVIKDFSKTTYSSARAALLQAYRVFRVHQQLLVRHLCQPVWEVLLEEAYLRGELDAPRWPSLRWEYTRALWIPPGWEWVDPLKEAKAAELEVRMLHKTRADVAAERGHDWEAKAEQAKREKDVFEELDLPWEGMPQAGGGDESESGTEGPEREE